MKKLIFGLTCMLLILAACSKDLDEPFSAKPKQTPVLVQLDLQAEEQQGITRMMDENAIQDVNIFLYGVEDYHFYFPVVNNTLTFEVLPGNYTACVVANARKDMSNLDEQQLSETKIAAADMYAQDAILMTVRTPLKVSDLGTSPSLIRVARCAAKIDYTIKVDDAVSSSIKLRSVQFCNIPQTVVPFGTDELSSSNVADYADGEEVMCANSRVVSGVQYLLENLQGRVDTIIDQHEKSPENAPTCATYLRILAQRSVDGALIEYVVYMGENNTSDFNVKRNTKHSMNLVIRGENEIDSRVLVYNGLYYGTANCHICTGTQITFDATPYRTAKSRAYEYSGLYAGAEYQAVQAGLLWQDTKNLVRMVSFSNNKITVYTSGAEGNAVVALYDKLGIILWSFHIWCSAYLPATYSAAVNSLGNSYTIMERNLGATSAAWGYGLVYQWGRKDPFIGPSDATSKTDAKMYDMAGREIPFDAKGRVIGSSVENVIRTPMTFYYSNTTWHTENSPNPNLWGDPDIVNFEPRKSVYDPCPEGYKVPSKDWLLIVKKNGKFQVGSSSDLYISNHYVSGSFNRGWQIYLDGKGSNTLNSVFIPAAGVRNGYESGKGGLNSAGTQGNYWTATWKSDARAYCSYLNASTIAVGSSHHMVYGMRVRCVKEDL